MKKICKDILTGVEFKPSDRFVKIIRIEFDRANKRMIQWVEL